VDLLTYLLSCNVDPLVDYDIVWCYLG